MTKPNSHDDQPPDALHVFAARRLGWVTGWARRELGKAGRKLSDAAAAAREASAPDASQIDPLLQRLGRLVGENDGAFERLADDPAFWLLVERLAILRPPGFRRSPGSRTDESVDSALGTAAPDTGENEG